jgi:arylsulfatase A-like enzyme
MRYAGYRTYMTGKWHVTGVQPAEVFDEARHVRGGMPPSCEAAYERPKEGEPDLWQPWDESRGGHWTGGRHWSAVMADDAVAFLEAPRPADQPFFIYAAFNAPHDPRQSPKAFVDLYPPTRSRAADFLPSNPYKDAILCEDLRCATSARAPDPRTRCVQVHRGEYYALITYLDDSRRVHEPWTLGTGDNTVVFLTGDNGFVCGAARLHVQTEHVARQQKGRCSSGARRAKETLMRRSTSAISHRARTGRRAGAAARAGSRDLLPAHPRRAPDAETTRSRALHAASAHDRWADMEAQTGIPSPTSSCCRPAKTRTSCTDLAADPAHAKRSAGF